VREEKARAGIELANTQATDDLQSSIQSYPAVISPNIFPCHPATEHSLRETTDAAIG